MSIETLFERTDGPKRMKQVTTAFCAGAVLCGFSVFALPLQAQENEAVAESLEVPDHSDAPAPFVGPTQDALQEMTETEGGAVYRGLDKITARVSTIYAPLDEVVGFGSLRFVTRHCNKRPPEETPEKTAFLEVRDIKPDETEEELFKGWMFASSPALNALEHPVYDIWLMDCIIIEPETSEGSE